MAYDTSKLTKLAALKALALRTKAAQDAIDGRVKTLENAHSQANVIEGVKVNGALLELADKIADILIAEGATNGSIKVNNVDVPVHGLAAMAFKANVAYADLAEALQQLIDSKAAQSALDTLTGSGDGSISKMIDSAINTFATNVSDDNVVNSFKELVDWVAAHGPEAAEMAGDISDNATAISDLATLVGELPQGATATTVVGYIAEAISALSIGDYAKTSEVTETLKSYYTKTEIDGMIATDAQVTEMLNEVFGDPDEE